MTAMPELERPRIKPLPPLLVNQLAAGEIVTRPASVVKELVENAIDAGATRIIIKVTQGGTGLIEVADNGCGIHPDDMIMAVTRFATSKIADVANLQGIRTLGFRGEALASTAAVSRLTLASSHDGSGIGRKLTVAGILDDAPVLTPVVHPKGTTVTVKDLYFNVPARRGNLKSIATEFAHIETVIQGLAMAVSHINIELWHNDKKRYDFKAIDSQTPNQDYNLNATNLADATFIQQILHRLNTVNNSANNMGAILSTQTSAQTHNECIIPLNVDLSGLITKDNQFGANEDANLTQFTDFQSSNIASSNIKGALFIAPCLYNAHHHKTNLPKLIYINGRLVKDALIAQHLRNLVPLVNTPAAPQQGNSSTIGIDSLGYVLFFNLPQAWLNINVHPSKQRIGIGHLSNILAHLNVALTSRLRAWQRDFKTPPQTITSTPTNQNDTSDIYKTPKHQANLKVQENVQPYQFDQFHQSNEKTNKKEHEKQEEVVHKLQSSAVRTANPISSSNHHKNPRAIMWVARAQLQKLSPTQHLTTQSLNTNTDRYLLIQDLEATSIIGLNHVQTFLAQHQPIDLEPLENSDLDAINTHLANWFNSFTDVNTDADNSIQAQQKWQHFISNHSIVSLSHEQLLPLLLTSSS